MVIKSENLRNESMETFLGLSDDEKDILTVLSKSFQESIHAPHKSWGISQM